MSQRTWRLRSRLAGIAPFAGAGLANGSSAGCDVGGQIVGGELVAGAAWQRQIEGELAHAQGRAFLHTYVKFHEQGEVSGYYKVLCSFAMGDAFEAVLADVTCLIESRIAQLHGAIRFPRDSGEYQLALHAHGALAPCFQVEADLLPGGQEIELMP